MSLNSEQLQEDEDRQSRFKRDNDVRLELNEFSKQHRKMTSIMNNLREKLTKIKRLSYGMW